MKRFQRYVLINFLKYIVISGLFINLMSFISSAMSESKDLASYSYSISDFAILILYSLALSLNITMPAITTIAALIVIIMLMRSNELLAYVSLGGKILNLAIPFITVGIFISTGMIYWEYKVIPDVRIAREQHRDKIQGKNFKHIATYFNRWMIDENSKLVNIELIDTLNGKINGITEYTINDKYEIIKIERIKNAAKDGDFWKTTDRQITDIRDNPPTITEIKGEETVKNKLWDNLMKVAVTDVRALSPSQLSTLSNVMKQHGLNTSYYDLLYYSKFSNAISVLVLLILTFPIAINFSRNYSIIKNVAIALFLGLTFWVFQASCYSFGKTGILSPFIANFMPIFVFIIISTVILYMREYRK